MFCLSEKLSVNYQMQIRPKEIAIKILLFGLIPMSTFPSHCQDNFKAGLMEESDLNKLYVQKWFANKYSGFTPDPKLYNGIAEDIKDSKVLVFMGTWCHDTKILLPKFFKVLDSMKIPKEQIITYNVGRKKLRPRKPIKEFGVKYLPTFIFIKEGKELGRIVEVPFSSLEEDVANIYQKN